jgi:hypothetical protein
MRSRSAQGLAALFIVLAATPAQAQSGGGLYEPFPAPAPRSEVRRFIAALPGLDARFANRISNHDLSHGRFLGALRGQAAGAGAATARAETGSDALGALAGTAIVALALGAGLMLARRPRAA